MIHQNKNEIIQQLFKYQSIDNELKAIKNKLNSTEEFKKLYQAKKFLKTAEDSLKSMGTRVAELNIKLERLSSEVEENCQLIAEYEGSIDKSEDVDELNYLERKTDQLSKSLETQEKEIASLISEIEQHIAVFNDLKTKVPVYREQFSEYKEKYDVIKGRAAGEMDKKTKQLDAIAGKIENAGGKQVLEQYKKLSADGVAHPIVQLRADNRCGGCNVDLPTSTIDRIAEKSYTICDHCGRIIYK